MLGEELSPALKGTEPGMGVKDSNAGSPHFGLLGIKKIHTREQMGATSLPPHPLPACLLPQPCPQVKDNHLNEGNEGNPGLYLANDSCRSMQRKDLPRESSRGTFPTTHSLPLMEIQVTGP